MARRIRRPDFVPQMEITDCGAACLAMSLSLFGIRIPLREVRSATGTGRDGVTGGGLIRAARRLGLEAVGVRLAVRDLPSVPVGSILHWNANHFVVLAGRSAGNRSGADAVRHQDAEGGRRRALDHWSGLFDRYLDAQQRRGRVATLVETGLTTVQSAAPLAALALGLGEMLAGVTMLSALVVPVAGLVQASFRIALVRTYALRMLDVFETPRERKVPEGPPARISGTIDISDLSFRYSELAPLPVRDVSISIPRGSLVALVGR